MGKKRSSASSAPVSVASSPSPLSPPSPPSSPVKPSPVVASSFSSLAASSSSSSPSPVMAYVLTGVVGASIAYLLGAAIGLQLPLLTPLFRLVSLRILSPVMTAIVLGLVSAYLLVRLANQTAAANASGALGSSSAYLSLVAGWFGTKAVDKDSAEYAAFFDPKKGGGVDARKKDYMKLVNHYYNLVTDFYEYGWGYCFHFGRRFKGEDFHASLARHEYWLANQGGFGPGQTVLDLGCGVGGPMRAIARFCGANIVGINNNAYQIARGNRQVEAAGLSQLCSFKQCDFMNLDFKDNTIDGAYAIEATCHAPDKTKCFREIFRVLKPGAHFVGYEWCMTDKYDAKNPTHRAIKHGIEVGDGLPDLVHTSEIARALTAAGFEVVAEQDLAPLDSANTVPWYATLDAAGGLQNFRSSRLGIVLTHCMCTFLEFVRLAPKGTVATHAWLSSAIAPLRDGGKTGIFTPMYFFKAVKPAASSSSSSSRGTATAGATR